MSVVGHDVKREAATRAVSEAINRGIEAACKRRLESWCPTVHWGLLARGRIDGAVCYRPDEEEQRLGELFVEAVGYETARSDDGTEPAAAGDGGTEPATAGEDGEWFVAARTDPLFEELLAVVEDAL